MAALYRDMSSDVSSMIPVWQNLHLEESRGAICPLRPRKWKAQNEAKANAPRLSLLAHSVGEIGEVCPVSSLASPSPPRNPREGKSHGTPRSPTVTKFPTISHNFHSRVERRMTTDIGNAAQAPATSLAQRSLACAGSTSTDLPYAVRHNSLPSSDAANPAEQAYLVRRKFVDVSEEVELSGEVSAERVSLHPTLGSTSKEGANGGKAEGGKERERSGSTLRERVLRRRSMDGGSLTNSSASNSGTLSSGTLEKADSECGSDCLNWEDVESYCDSMDNASLKVEEIDMQVVQGQDGEDCIVYKIKFEGNDMWYYPRGEELDTYLAS